MLKDAKRKGRLNQWGLRKVIAFLFCLNVVVPSPAAELTHVDVDSEEGVYSIRLEMQLNVTADYVKDVLTDFQHIYRLNPSIVESRLLPSPHEGTVRVYTRMKGCVLFYCTGFARVEDVREQDSGELVAVIVPGMGDFISGAALWRISEDGERSRLVYEAHLQPKFFIPPLIGSFLVKQKLKTELLTVFQHIECDAVSRMWVKMIGNEGVPGKKEKSMVC